MKLIQLEIITPVHVGSGRSYMGNFEYLYFEEDRKIAVIDDKKVLDLIGREHLTEWMQVIHRRNNLLTFLQKTTGQKISPEQVARKEYMITISILDSEPEASQEIRAQIRTGLHQPIIPGSSVKGAARTAFFAKQLSGKYAPGATNRSGNNEKIYNTELVHIIDGINFKGKWPKDPPLMKEQVSADPNHDVFRLWRLGDLTFDRTVCMLTNVLNYRGGKYELSSNLEQWVEAIPSGSISRVPFQDIDWLRMEIAGKMQLHNQKLQNLQDRRERLSKDMIKTKDAQEILLRHINDFSLEKLMKMVNAHSLRLIQNEINTWKPKTYQLPSQGVTYIMHLEALLRTAEGISKQGEPACLLRLGFGSGIKSMTGDWQQDLLGKQYDARNKEMSESKYVPKTRRMTSTGQPMGFVKLSLV